MREHMGLFRGKGVSGHHLDEWVYGYYCKDFWKPRKGHGIIPINEDDGGYVEVDPETVGECTGMKDKNGKRIFEGDIVQFYGTYALEVFIEHGHTMIRWFDTVTNTKCTELFFAYDEGFDEVCEIIGNIHDNPELLEVNK